MPPEVIEKLMGNNRLYNIILQNYPDVLTRRRSEVNLSAEEPPADAVLEPAKLPLQIKYKMPKDASKAANKSDDKAKEADAIKKDKENTVASGNDNLIKSDNKLKNTSHARTVQPSNWLVRQISIDHHYFKNMPLYRNNMMYRGTMMTIPRYRLKASSLPDIYRNSMWSLESESDDEMVIKSNLIYIFLVLSCP